MAASSAGSIWKPWCRKPSVSKMPLPNVISAATAVIPAKTGIQNAPRSLGSSLGGNDGQRGFTLVEMVVSLTILSLVTLATVSALRTLADTQARLETTVERMDEMRLVSRFIRERIGQTMPLNTPLTFGPYFKGDAGQVVWIGPIAGAGEVSGVQFMRLFRDGGELKIQFEPYHRSKNEPQWGSARAYPLLGDVSELQVSYRESPEEPWVDSWGEDTEALPWLVKVRLRVRGRYWPDLVIPIAQHQADQQQGLTF